MWTQRLSEGRPKSAEFKISTSHRDARWAPLGPTAGETSLCLSCPCEHPNHLCRDTSPSASTATSRSYLGSDDHYSLMAWSFLHTQLCSVPNGLAVAPSPQLSTQPLPLGKRATVPKNTLSPIPMYSSNHGSKIFKKEKSCLYSTYMDFASVPLLPKEPQITLLCLPFVRLRCHMSSREDSEHTGG